MSGFLLSPYGIGMTFALVIALGMIARELYQMMTIWYHQHQDHWEE